MNQSLGNIVKLCERQQLKDALELLSLTGPHCAWAYLESCICLLQTCTKRQNLIEGRIVHANLVKSLLEPNDFTWNTLINMYAKCGSMDDAWGVFTEMPMRNMYQWTTVITGYAKLGNGRQALLFFRQMQDEGIKPDKVTLITVLNACACISAMAWGKLLHVLSMGLVSIIDSRIHNTIIDMYAKCGSIDDAQKVFAKLHTPDVVSWSVMITAHAVSENGVEALELFQLMQKNDVEPNEITMIGVLSACTSISAIGKGKWVHAKFSKTEHEWEASLSNNLLDMYVKCAAIDNACQVFDRLHQRDVVSWSIMISEFTLSGNCQDALLLYRQMQLENTKPDKVTFLSILNASANIASLGLGKYIHAKVITNWYAFDLSIVNTLIDMYAKCGSIEDAQCLFDSLPVPDVVSWSGMIMGYAQHGNGIKALMFFRQMGLEGVRSDEVTIIGILCACSIMKGLEVGKLLHAHIFKYQWGSGTFLENTLIDMYIKCGALGDAEEVFRRMVLPNVISWNAMLTGCVQYRGWLEVINMFDLMRNHANTITFVTVLSACSENSAIGYGKYIHACSINYKHELEPRLGNSLLHIYATYGNMEDGCQFFDRLPTQDVVSWNTIIAWYAFHCKVNEVFKLFSKTLQRCMQSDDVTYVMVLRACDELAAYEWGKWVHASILRTEYGLDLDVGNSILEMYIKCGSYDDAHQLFGLMPTLDLTSWNVMLAAGNARQILQCYELMHMEGIQANSLIFVTVLNACADIAALEQGKRVHMNILKLEHALGSIVSTSIVDMYAKCGSIENANQVFDQMLAKDVISWNAIIAGHAQNGDGKEVLSLLSEMELQDVQPDRATFTSALTACSHASLVDEGFYYFCYMNIYVVTPVLQHYSCLVDLLGRVGSLDEAKDLIEGMPYESSVEVWTSLLGSCRTYEDLELAENSIEYVLQLQHLNAAPFVLLSNIYALAARKLRALAISH